MKQEAAVHTGATVFFSFPGESSNVAGFGHTHIDQIIDLASQAEVVKLVLVHHDLVEDSIMEEREAEIQELAAQKGLEAVIAREGMRYPLI